MPELEKNDPPVSREAVSKLRLFRLIWISGVVLMMLPIFLSIYLVKKFGNAVVLCPIILGFLIHVICIAKVRDIKCPKCGSDFFYNAYFTMARVPSPFKRECDVCDFKI